VKSSGRHSSSFVEVVVRLADMSEPVLVQLRIPIGARDLVLDQQMEIAEFVMSYSGTWRLAAATSHWSQVMR
jgi:hypothetical protein